ncbi:pitrilysin family protein, partial [Nostoc sp. CHAB 5715]|uniref:M16 family metallopeptidase n=1 Tax=Nostoc sp. CHAB 5715 TaxID=2780400 RepID=UPI001E4B65F0
IMLDIGSRDELPHQTGLAHFWEHMAFKGTKKRKSYHIINRLEAVGGELNAYTTKEKVCFYASLLDIHFEKSVELLCDITFNSIFPEKQIEKERGVILEEMSMYLDSPEDSIQDDFDALLFPEHQLGANILGTQESVKSFSKKHLQDFIAENLDTEKIIFSVVGNIDARKAFKIIEKYLRDIPKDCSVLGTTRIATLPGQEWIDRALARYFEYSLEQEAQANADALEIEIQDYYLMFPEYDPSLGSKAITDISKVIQAHQAPSIPTTKTNAWFPDIPQHISFIGNKTRGVNLITIDPRVIYCLETVSSLVSENFSVNNHSI